MAYQSKYKGREVEYILDNALLKKEQPLTDEEKQLIKNNLGIKPDKDDIMAIELSETGEMILSYGEESNLSDGYISDNGELVLEFNFE